MFSPNRLVLVTEAPQTSTPQNYRSGPTCTTSTVRLLAKVQNRQSGSSIYTRANYWGCLAMETPTF